MNPSGIVALVHTRNSGTLQNAVTRFPLLKRAVLLALLILAVVRLNAQSDTLPGTFTNQPTADRSYIFGNKTINVSEAEGQLSVKVFLTDDLHRTTALLPIYEGMFGEEKTIERYTVAEDLGFQFPININRKKSHSREFAPEMEGHWAGFGFGLSQVSTSAYQLTGMDGYRLNSDKSFEWILNTNEFILPLISNRIGLTTGLGFDWRNYMLEGNVHMEEINGYLQVTQAQGREYKWGRLRSLHLTVPLFLEWQPKIGQQHDLFFTAGVVGGLKCFANYKVKYLEHGDYVKVKTANGHEMNMPTLTLDYMVQAGYKNLAVYAKYAPMGMFRENEGPNVHAVSMGVLLHFKD